MKLPRPLRRLFQIGLLILVLLFCLFIWRFFVLQPDNVSYHHDLKLTTDKTEYSIGDSIELRLTIEATDNDGLVRLFNDQSNQQIYVRKAIDGDISPSDWGTFESAPYESKRRFPFGNWKSYRLSKGERIIHELKGAIYLDTNNNVVFDFDKHGKYKSSIYSEYALCVRIYEIFPDVNFIIELDYFVPHSNFIYIKLTDPTVKVADVIGGSNLNLDQKSHQDTILIQPPFKSDCNYFLKWNPRDLVFEERDTLWEIRTSSNYRIFVRSHESSKRLLLLTTNRIGSVIDTIHLFDKECYYGVDSHYCPWFEIRSDVQISWTDTIYSSELFTNDNPTTEDVFEIGSKTDTVVRKSVFAVSQEGRFVERFENE